jgi:GNAT superfamily N-acetyltransferase
MNKLSAPQPLNAEHDTAAFDCGSPPLNEFLKLHALDKQRAMLSRTYVVTDKTSGTSVVGYYTLAHIPALQTDVPKKLGRGMPSAIPALLMARFAVDTAYQGQGLGRSLFTDAIQRTWSVMQAGAAPVRLFVVDAKDEKAKAFYEHFGMTATPQNPLRLYLSYKSLRALFEDVGKE